MREDIYGGLKNAVEKGESLDVAIQSFINAGYNAQEVREAAQMLGYGAMSILNPVEKKVASPSVQAPTAPVNLQQPPRTNGWGYESNRQLQRTSSRKTGAIIFLIVMLLILVGGLLAVFLFKDKIIDFFSTL